MYQTVEVQYVDQYGVWRIRIFRNLAFSEL